MGSFRVEFSEGKKMYFVFFVFLFPLFFSFLPCVLLLPFLVYMVLCTCLYHFWCLLSFHRITLDFKMSSCIFSSIDPVAYLLLQVTFPLLILHSFINPHIFWSYTSSSFPPISYNFVCFYSSALKLLHLPFLQTLLFVTLSIFTLL